MVEDRFLDLPSILIDIFLDPLDVAELKQVEDGVHLFVEPLDGISIEALDP